MVPWAAIPFAKPDGVEVQVVDTDAMVVRAVVRLDGAESVRARLQGRTLTLVDDRGRVLVLDLECGELVQSLRL